MKESFATRGIGPRKVGDITYSGYWRTHNLILAVVSATSDGWSITEADCDELGNVTGRARTHCTAWDAHRDRIVRSN